jgi:tRNA (cytidine/uridine-2'-O-)-methyltransferase
VLGLGKKLILVGPLGFAMDDKTLKRAQLDYWENLRVEAFPNWKAFVEQHNDVFERGHFFSAQRNREQSSVDLDKVKLLDYAVLGSEVTGLDSLVLPLHAKFCRIPMQQTMRSFNLASSASMILWESYRQRQ